MNSKIILCLLLVLLFCTGCMGRHKGEIYIHSSDHAEVVLDRPMSMELERDGVKVKVDSRKTGFFEDLLKLLILKW